MEYDVVIVGAGPAGLAAAIRLKQLNPDASVVVVEKGSEVGAHILSGAVIDPVGLDRCCRTGGTIAARPLKTEVTEDRFYLLGPAGGMRLPNFAMPKLMDNHGCFVGSLGNVARYLAAQAEALGVEIYPGFAATELLFDDAGAVRGVATGDMGIAGTARSRRTPSPAAWSCVGATRCWRKAPAARSPSRPSPAIVSMRASDPQKYAIGVKEIWDIDPALHKQGLVQHSMGWPLDNRTGGGSFIYHIDEQSGSRWGWWSISIMRIRLCRRSMSFQRFKTHPMIAPMCSRAASRVAYGARAITEGGWQSVPKLVFPGGALLGCAAGFVNVARIKGSAQRRAVGDAGGGKRGARRWRKAAAHDELAAYERRLARKRHRPRPCARSQRKTACGRSSACCGGVALGGLDMWTQRTLGFSFFGTMKPRQARSRLPEAARAGEPHRLPEARRQTHF
jgi:electron-transferring-flavoprotein dehydrogenase